MAAKKKKRATGSGLAQRVQMVLDRLDRLSRVESITPDQLHQIEDTVGGKWSETLTVLAGKTVGPEKKTKFVFDDEKQLSELRSSAE